MRQPSKRAKPAQARLGILLVSPTVAGLALFVAAPIAAAIILSFCSWDILSPPRFVGVSNYRAIATGTLRGAFENTALFALAAVSLQLVVGLAMALGVRRMPRRLQTIFRSAFFLPLTASAASMAVVLSYFFSQDFGPINYYLKWFGLRAIPWLTSMPWAFLAIIATYVWSQVGFTFLLFLGGLNAIPQELHDAARVDGARGWRQLRLITLPLLSPTILVASVIGFIGALDIFDQVYILTNGGPGTSTESAVMALYQQSFEFLHFGQGSAIAVLLCVVIGAVTLAQFRLSRRFVFYK